MAKIEVKSSIEITIASLELPAKFHTFSGVNSEHLALGLGNFLVNDAPLVRLHSECLTGDVFASLKCDCRKQLEEAIANISEVGGYLLYLRQEGRGIGLYNKLDAYILQSAGVDTFAANEALGFKRDGRDYEEAASMLKALGVHRIRLLTNNMDKVEQMQRHGISIVEVVNTDTYCNKHNKKYLLDKALLSNHVLDRNMLA